MGGVWVLFCRVKSFGVGIFRRCDWLLKSWCLVEVKKIVCLSGLENVASVKNYEK